MKPGDSVVITSVGVDGLPGVFERYLNDGRAVVRLGPAWTHIAFADEVRPADPPGKVNLALSQTFAELARMAA